MPALGIRPIIGPTKNLAMELAAVSKLVLAMFSQGTTQKIEIQKSERFHFSVGLALALSVVALFGTSRDSWAKHHHSSQAATTSNSTHSSKSSSAHIASRSHHGRQTLASRHGRHHGAVAHAKPRYAYPIGCFMARPPAFDTAPLSSESSAKIAHDFYQGTADTYNPRTLVRAGVVSYHPLRGGVFWRREPIKYIILHSTETGSPLGAVRVIESWSSMGRRHPGAQFVIDRDGTIYQAVDPDLATVHINIFKTKPGINNDNSVGIEMCHTGSQDYPAALRLSAKRLVTYLQQHYNIADGNIVTHRYAQNGDHTDPVNFDVEGFLAEKNVFKNGAIAGKVRDLALEATAWSPVSVPPTFLQPHQALPMPESTAVPASATLSPLKDKITRSSETSNTDSHNAGVPVPELRAPMEMDPSQAQLLDSSPVQNTSSVRKSESSFHSP